MVVVEEEEVDHLHTREPLKFQMTNGTMTCTAVPVPVVVQLGVILGLLSWLKTMTNE